MREVSTRGLLTLILATLGTLIVILWASMPSARRICEVQWPMVLEYLKVALSWPPLLFLGALLFIKRFQSNIGGMIDRLKSFGYPGGTVTLTEAAQQTALANPQIELPGEKTPEQAQAPTQEGAPPAGTEAVDRSFPAELARLLPHADIPAAIEFARTNPGPTVRDFVELQLRFGFERIFNLIFGSQVLLLERLQAVNTLTNVADLMQFYDQHRSLATNNPSQLISFLGFLQTQGLIVNEGPAEGPLYRITEVGSRFLGYIKQFYPLSWNTRPL